MDYNESWDALQRYRDEIFELHNTLRSISRESRKVADVIAANRTMEAPPPRFFLQMCSSSLLGRAKNEVLLARTRRRQVRRKSDDRIGII